MGLMEKLSSWLGGPVAGKEITILVLGLDHSGKTSLLNALRPPDRKVTSEPTLAPRQDNFTFGGISVVAVEAGGARRVRALWERQYAAASGVLWVADAADALRLAVARDEMQLMLEHPAMRARRLPLLVCANKADLPHALPPAQVAAALGLERVTDKPWHVCATSAVSGEGLTDGLAWLTRQLRDLHTDN